MLGIVLGAVLVVPFALPFIRTIASSRNALPFSAVWAPAYFEAVSNLLIWMGLLVELPAAVYAITQTGRRSP